MLKKEQTVSDQEDPDELMPSVACSGITYGDGFKRVGSVIARDEVGGSLTQMGLSSNSMGLE
jgi:hypothetical protein